MALANSLPKSHWFLPALCATEMKHQLLEFPCFSRQLISRNKPQNTQQIFLPHCLIFCWHCLLLQISDTENSENSQTSNQNKTGSSSSCYRLTFWSLTRTWIIMSLCALKVLFDAYLASQWCFLISWILLFVNKPTRNFFLKHQQEHFPGQHKPEQIWVNIPDAITANPTLAKAMLFPGILILHEPSATAGRPKQGWKPPSSVTITCKPPPGARNLPCDVSCTSVQSLKIGWIY